MYGGFIIYLMANGQKKKYNNEDMKMIVAHYETPLEYMPKRCAECRFYSGNGICEIIDSQVWHVTEKRSINCPLIEIKD